MTAGIQGHTDCPVHFAGNHRAGAEPLTSWTFEKGPNELSWVVRRLAHCQGPVEETHEGADMF